ncbi:glycosyltransferase family 2 protein [Celeribacter neptunius]|uniref:Glycosyltransferase involved in cell wall bisynthesis n=1 Tax=Celeribacter neptunius TaxID=588602 RepID=A0A1I3SVU8_9RHOB|nr:glycosyltransferase family 2 protein [Celeribacter neptunius]SFJ62493.1 Glycosyltransferase involved in cell wall bisynthesis [Celeribacter neptunius]
MLDVLIPHFNDAEALDLSLRSVAAQTWRGKVRVIVVDDGSPSDELRRAEAIISSCDLDIELIKQPENRGRPATRNTLLSASDARFIAWLDAGDTWYEKKLETQFNTLYKQVYDGQDLSRIWVTCNYDWQWVGGRRRKVTQTTSGDQLKHLYVGDRLRAYLWTLLGTREAFNLVSGFDERLPRLQDLDYFISFVRGGGRLISAESSDALCCYFKSDVGRNAQEIRDCYETIFSKHGPSLNRFGVKFVRRAKAKADFVAARFAKNNRTPLVSLGFRMHAFGMDPRYTLYRAKKSLRNG